MILFVSDVHLGRGSYAEDRGEEQALVQCLNSYEDLARGLVLLGDVFDSYIEYRHLIPKGFVRLQALLASWTDRGIPVIYVVGNHDPWHLDYFEKELGVLMVRDSLLETLHTHLVYLHHGDTPKGSGRHLHRLLRHPVPVWLYRTALSPDFGLSLAGRTSRSRPDEQVDRGCIAAASRHAGDILHSTAANLVVMGHTHHAELTKMRGGIYLNTGSWRYGRNFGCLERNTIGLLQWNENEAIVVQQKSLSSTPDGQETP